MTTLTPTELGYQRLPPEFGSEEDDLPAVLTSTPLNTCGIILGMLFMTNTTMLADLQQTLVEGWDAILQQSDQHEEEVLGWCGCVWFYTAEAPDC